MNSKMEIKINSDNVKYHENYIEAKYEYQYTKSTRDGNKITVSEKKLLFSQNTIRI